MYAYQPSVNLKNHFSAVLLLDVQNDAIKTKNTTNIYINQIQCGGHRKTTTQVFFSLIQMHKQISATCVCQSDRAIRTAPTEALEVPLFLPKLHVVIWFTDGFKMNHGINS